MIVHGHALTINFLEELEPYLNQFPMYTVRDNKLMSCSPFREERRPSFAINLEHGGFIDSGSTDPLYHKGNFIRLMSFLMLCTEEEVESYLLQKYYWSVEESEYELNLNLEKPNVVVDLSTLVKSYQYRHPYLESRGVSELVQQHFEIGYDKGSNSVTMPWHNLDGTIVNIKYRNIHCKNFFFVSGAAPIKHHLYGMYMVNRYGKDKVTIVESEIDALYLWSNRIPAIALGGSSISRSQINILLASQVNTVILATDNDENGRKIKHKLFTCLCGYMRVMDLGIPSHYNDVNEIPSKELLELYNHCNDYSWEVMHINK